MFCYAQIGEGTYTVFIENNRIPLFTAARQILDETFDAGR